MFVLANLSWTTERGQLVPDSFEKSPIQEASWLSTTVEPLYKGHLSNEDALSAVPTTELYKSTSELGTPLCCTTVLEHGLLWSGVTHPPDMLHKCLLVFLEFGAWPLQDLAGLSALLLQGGETAGKDRLTCKGGRSMGWEERGY